MIKASYNYGSAEKTLDEAGNLHAGPVYVYMEDGYGNSVSDGIELDTAERLRDQLDWVIEGLREARETWTPPEPPKPPKPKEPHSYSIVKFDGYTPVVGVHGQWYFMSTPYTKMSWDDVLNWVQQYDNTYPKYETLYTLGLTQ